MQFKTAWSVHILVISLRFIVSLRVSLKSKQFEINFSSNRPFSSSELTALSGANLLSSLAWLIPLQGTEIPHVRLGLQSQIFLYNNSHDGVIDVTEVYDIKSETYFKLA